MHTSHISITKYKVHFVKVTKYQIQNTLHAFQMSISNYLFHNYYKIAYLVYLLSLILCNSNGPNGFIWTPVKPRIK